MSKDYVRRWKAYFEHFDANHNNFIEPSDFGLVGKKIDQVSTLKHGGETIEFIFEDYFITFLKYLGSNKSKLSYEELLAAVEGFVAPGWPEWWRDLCYRFFDSMDINNNGQLSLQEVILCVRSINPNETDANITRAYEWAKKFGKDGKFDKFAWDKVINIWATSADPTPECDVLLPCFRNV